MAFTPSSPDRRYIDPTSGRYVAPDPSHAHLHDHPDRPPTNRTPVVSSNLGWVQYVGAGFLDYLDIYFDSSKTIYRYYDVPWSIYWGLMNAPSHGIFHDRHIKWAFKYTQI